MSADSEESVGPSIGQRLLWDGGAWGIGIATEAFCYYGYWWAAIFGGLFANLLGFIEGLNRGSAIVRRVFDVTNPLRK